MRAENFGQNILELGANWIEAVDWLSKRGEAFVLVTILGVRGSAPRDTGTKMVVTEDKIVSSIGGGHLEHKAIRIGREMMAAGEQAQHIEHFPLGPALGQCCGGSVSLLFERFASADIDIMLFGAGHVGRALAVILADLPCRLHWVDSREGQFPPILSSNLNTVVSEQPSDEVASMKANSYYIVMTHNHQQDFDICSSILKRGDFEYLGLIGSKIKWARFKQRLQHRYQEDGVRQDANQGPKKGVDDITCPIGLSEVGGKRPMEVAVSIAAEIIRHYQMGSLKSELQQGVRQGVQQGLKWSEIKSLSTKLLVEE